MMNNDIYFLDIIYMQGNDSGSYQVYFIIKKTIIMIDERKQCDLLS